MRVVPVQLQRRVKNRDAAQGCHTPVAEAIQINATLRHLCPKGFYPDSWPR